MNCEFCGSEEVPSRDNGVASFKCGSHTRLDGGGTTTGYPCLIIQMDKLQSKVKQLTDAGDGLAICCNSFKSWPETLQCLQEWWAAKSETQ